MSDGATAGRGGDDATDDETRLRLAVPAMDCPSCAQKVDRSLDRVDGIREVALRPTTGTAVVTYDPATAHDGDVVAAVEGAGYEVTSTGRETGDDGGGGGREVAPPEAIWTTPRALATWVGAGAVALGLALAFVITGANPVVATLLGRPIALADLLFLVAVAVSGGPVVRGGYYSARNLSLDIDLLMATAILAATGIGFFVEAATLAVLYSVAELLETYAMDRARDSLRELMELSPDEATVLRDDGEEETVPVDDVSVGATVAVRPGERVPLDGEVTAGESAVDESPITGESVPVDKAPGDEVYAGSINEAGYLEVAVTAAADDSTLSRIIAMVQGAQERKTEKEQFVDRFAGYYTPAIVVLAILTATVPPLALGMPWRTWSIRGLTLLVIACPCAFVISTPVSVVSGITSAARNGVLIKGGNHLEAMGDVDAVALDKTGTLTRGALAVTDVVPLGDADERDVLRIAGALERRSEHPIGDAIRARAAERGVDEEPAVSGFEGLVGRGVAGEVDGERWYVGKPELFADLGFPVGRDGDGATAAAPGDGTEEEGDGAGDGADAGVGAAAAEGLDDVIAALERDGKTVTLVGSEDELLGVVGIADELRPASRAAVAQLKALGVARVVMLTGDNEGTARAIADEVGVDAYRAELLPDEKVAAVEEIREEYGAVAMVGDGINDAPALAAADVGVAMGAAGTDTALETADIALMADDVGKLPYLYALSHKANGVIRQSIWSSLAVKALLAVGVPLGYVSVAVAVVVGDMGMSLGVTGNAMRLSRLKPEGLLDR